MMQNWLSKLLLCGAVSCGGVIALNGQALSAPSITVTNVPQDAAVPPNFRGNPIAFFDDFSWRSFIALVWPVLKGQRGVPDPSGSMADSTSPRVFETFKSDWEVFQPNGNAPAAWDVFSPVNPGNVPNLSFGDVELASFSKFGNLGQAGGSIGKLVGPLVAQNGTYLRFLTAFNKTEFEQILDRKLFLQANLTNMVFNFGALDVKSAWMEMTNVSHPERYYTRQAYVLDLVTGTCTLKTMGLVGLHIVQKTPSRPQWIWSTFEQIDNVPPSSGVPMALNDGTGTPMPPSNPIHFPPPAAPPAPFNVTRVMPTNPSTQATNKKYQDALRGANSVWQFYQLVMTQWPVPQPPATTNVIPSQPGTANFTFPGLGATSSFANAALETFDQSNVRFGCMACHNATKDNSDFVWSLSFNAFPQPILGNVFTTALGAPQNNLFFAPKRTTNTSIERLKNMLQNLADESSIK